MLCLYLEVARIGAGAEDEADAALGVLPGAAHEAAGRVVEDGAHLDVHVTTPRYGERIFSCIKSLGK